MTGLSWDSNKLLWLKSPKICLYKWLLLQENYYATDYYYKQFANYYNCLLQLIIITEVSWDLFVELMGLSFYEFTLL